MRFFEIIMAVATAISIINLIFIRSNRAGLLLSAMAAIAAAAGIIAEGYRLFMLPAYLLSLILMLLYTVRSIRHKNTAGSRLVKTTGPALSCTPSSALPDTVGSALPCAPASALIKAAGVTLLVLLYIAALVLAVLFPVIDLPEPSGPYLVGTTLMAFTDTSREGAPTGSAGVGSKGAEFTGTESAGYRNIPIQIWYPATDVSEKQRVNWMNSSKMSSWFAKCKNLPDILGQLTLIKTNSYLDAELSEKEKEYPVVLFSGGGAMFNGQNAIQMEELASHGYIVCAVGHPYDDFSCEYPDGTIIPYDPGHLKALGEDIQNALEAAKKEYGEDGDNPEFIRYVLHNCTLNNADVVKWSEDMSFVVDELIKLNNGLGTENVELDIIDTKTNPVNAEQGLIDTMNMFTGRLDLERLAIFGHSFGGAAAGEACLHDNRFKAFINMDGAPFGAAADYVISQPFMILTTGKDEKDVIDKGYCADQKNFISIYINDAEHMNFSDFNTIIPNIGKLTGLLGKIDGDRHREITNNYILAFFNKHLKGMQNPALEGSTPEYPEVMLEVNQAN